MIRLFAALSPPEPVRDRLEMVRQGLPGRLVPRANLHVTLAFFGEIDEAQAADVHAALLAVRGAAFDYWLDGVGAFGGARPRLIYAAVRPDPALEVLHETVAQAGRDAGLTVEAARYVPHVTLTRLRPGELTDRACARALAGRAAFLAGPARADGFGLYRSDLGHGGPVYSLLQRYRLR